MTVAQRGFAETGRGEIVGANERLDIWKERAHARHSRCDLSHRQGVILHHFTCDWISCEDSHMSAGHNMDELRASLQKAMDERGIKAKPLAIAAGLGETAVRDILKGKTQNVQIGTLHKIAEILEWPVSDLIGDDRVRIEGNIGAGGAILFERSTDMETVPRPPGFVGPIIALMVRGDSMLPVYRDGDIVYIRRDHEGVLPEYLGEECAVHTADGGTYLKVLAQGHAPDRYTLRSFNAADMEGVELIWAAPVLFVRRRPAKPHIEAQLQN